MIRSGAQLSVIGDVSSGGFTSIETGAQVVAGGAFNHTNSSQDFRVTGSDGNGGFSSLTISDVANSNVSSSGFLLDNTGLDLNSVSANGDVLIRSGAELEVNEDFNSEGFTSIESGAQVVVGGTFTHDNLTRDFSVAGSDSNSNRSSFTVNDTVNIEAGEFRSDGRTAISGSVGTAFAAVFFGGSTVAPGVESIQDLTFNTTDLAMEDHALELRSGATYEWELGSTGNDVISVIGDLQLNDFWELQLSIFDDFSREILASDRFDLFTYSDNLTANIDSSGLLSRVIINSSTINPSQFDITNAAVFDDGQGTVFLTGLESVPVPEPSPIALVLAVCCCCLKRQKSLAKYGS